MAMAWQTIEQAALTLGISTRTLHRRISKGEFPTRLQDGRREVMVDIPEPAPSPVSATTPPLSPPPTPAFPAQAAPVSDARSAMSDSSQASASSASATFVHDPEDDRAPSTNHETALMLAEDRIRRADLALAAFQQSAMAAANEARRARTGSLIAWSAVGVLVLGSILFTAWSTGRVSDARNEAKIIASEKESLTKRVNELSDMTDKAERRAEKVAQMADTAQQELIRATQEAARAEGQLETMRQVLASRPQPATQPARPGIFETVLSVLAKPASPTTAPSPR